VLLFFFHKLVSICLGGTFHTSISCRCIRSFRFRSLKVLWTFNTSSMPWLCLPSSTLRLQSPAINKQITSKPKWTFAFNRTRNFAPSQLLLLGYWTSSFTYHSKKYTSSIATFIGFTNNSWKSNLPCFLSDNSI